MKRTLSILIILALLLTVLPIAAFADGEIMGMWPDELPIDTTDCSVGEDGDTIDFGGSLSWDMDLPRDYEGAEVEMPLVTESVSQSPVTYTAAPQIVVTFFQELSKSSLRQDILDSAEGLKLALVSFGK